MSKIDKILLAVEMCDIPRYGVTINTIDSLKALDLLDCHYREVWLEVPSSAYSVAKLYLRHLFRKYKTTAKVIDNYITNETKRKEVKDIMKRST